MNWYKSSGILEYSKDPIIKLVLQVDQGLSDFYKSLIPKYFNVKGQAYKAHISVIMRGITPPNMSVWGKYQDYIIDFEYSPIIYNDDKYFWLYVSSPALEKIRLELGIKSFYKSYLDKNNEHIFHITIGNTK